MTTPSITSGSPGKASVVRVPPGAMRIADGDGLPVTTTISPVGSDANAASDAPTSGALGSPRTTTSFFAATIAFSAAAACRAVGPSSPSHRSWPGNHDT